MNIKKYRVLSYLNWLLHVKEIVYWGFFLVIKVFLLFIFLKIYASVNMPEICSSFTTCISMLGFLTHWILAFILLWLIPWFFLFFNFGVCQSKPLTFFCYAFIFFLWIIPVMKFIFYWYIRNPPLYLSIAVKKMIIRNSIVFSLILRTSVFLSIFFITL